MQAITTKYLGATNFRGSRIKATCQAGSITVAWDDALDVDANHVKAAKALADKLDWDTTTYGSMYYGALPDNTGYAFVFAGRSNQFAV
jgi:hypothetical protein